MFLAFTVFLFVVVSGRVVWQLGEGAGYARGYGRGERAGYAKGYRQALEAVAPHVRVGPPPGPTATVYRQDGTREEVGGRREGQRVVFDQPLSLEPGEALRLSVPPLKDT